MCLFTYIHIELRENFVVIVQYLITSEVSCIRIPGSKLCSKGINCLIKYSITMADTCECGNEPSGSIKCGELLD